jgi:hypothetical protein
MHFTIPVTSTTDSGFTLQIPSDFTEGGNTIPQGLYYVQHENAVVTPTSIAIKNTGFKGKQLDSVECRPTHRSWKGSYQIQFFTMRWEDGKIGDAACQIVAIVPEGGYPIQSWEQELSIEPDLTKTLEQRWLSAMKLAESKIIEDENLAYSGETAVVFPREWNLEWTPVPKGGRLMAANTPLGVLYKIPQSTVQGEFWGTTEAIQALWNHIAESQGVSPETSRQWLKDNEKYFPISGQEFHQWNAKR